MITVAFKPTPRRSANMPDNADYVINNWRINANPQTWRPPTDVFEREDSIVVRTEIAGMSEKDFAISLDQNALVIRGARTDTNERRAYHQMEINFGEFLTIIDISMPIETDQVQAEYQNGFLWVVLPKSQPKIIKVKDNE